MLYQSNRLLFKKCLFLGAILLFKAMLKQSLTLAVVTGRSRNATMAGVVPYSRLSLRAWKGVTPSAETALSDGTRPVLSLAQMLCQLTSCFTPQLLGRRDPGHFHDDLTGSHLLQPASSHRRCLSLQSQPRKYLTGRLQPRCI